MCTSSRGTNNLLLLAATAAIVVASNGAAAGLLGTAGAGGGAVAGGSAAELSAVQMAYGVGATTTPAATAAVGMTTAQQVSLGLTAVSAGMAVEGAYTQAQTQKAMAERNATVADMQAKDALTRGEKSAIQAGQAGSLIQGRQRAALAARGLDLSEGTPNDILAQTDFFTQSDVATARTNARREAFAAQSQRGNFQLQADSANPGLQFAGTLLGGGGRVADKWMQYGGR